MPKKKCRLPIQPICKKQNAYCEHNYGIDNPEEFKPRNVGTKTICKKGNGIYDNDGNYYISQNVSKFLLPFHRFALALLQISRDLKQIIKR